MTPELREQLRLSLLRLLALNPTDYGTPLGVLRALAAAEGRPDLTPTEVRAELLYLADAGLVRRVDKQISPELSAWRVTKAGRDYLAERGIEP